MENMTKELDELLQIYLPDEYYEDIRKNLIPALTRWKASGSVAAPKRVCPKCGSGKVIMFTSDDDLCQTCGATFPGVLNGPSELASLRQQLKEREEALKEFAQILLDYKHSGVEVNIDYLLDKFPYENIKGKI